jgi:hypothetical protein
MRIADCIVDWRLEIGVRMSMSDASRLSNPGSAIMTAIRNTQFAIRN